MKSIEEIEIYLKKEVESNEKQILDLMNDDTPVDEFREHYIHECRTEMRTLKGILKFIEN